jgi:hypothetical protein
MSKTAKALNTYTVYFRSDTESAAHDLEATTPQQALAQAKKLYADNSSELWFEPYDDGQPANEITVYDTDGNEVAAWLDDDLRLRLAAPALLAAAEKVLARWEQGDLADAVRELSAAIDEAKGGTA